jgi:hypothetical protein
MNIVNNKRLGDELISKILLLLLDDYDINNHFTESMKTTFSLDIKKSINYIHVIEHDLEIIINNEILKLKEYFHKIYTNHSIFTSIDLSIFTDVKSNIDVKSIDFTDKILVKYVDLKNLNYWINQIAISTNKLEQTLAMRNMIIIFNNLICDSNSLQVDLINDINIMLHPDIIKPNDSEKEIISVINSNINTKNETNLDVLDKTQLFDILIYIDSLRDSCGYSDNRFSGVQNIIIKELQKRSK